MSNSLIRMGGRILSDARELLGRAAAWIARQLTRLWAIHRDLILSNGSYTAAPTGHRCPNCRSASRHLGPGCPRHHRGNLVVDVTKLAARRRVHRAGATPWPPKPSSPD
jgi:hypothetical protein